MPGGDCSGLDDGGIGACYICWLVGLMTVVLMPAVIVKLLGVLQIWLRSIHMFGMLPITILMVMVLLGLLNYTNYHKQKYHHTLPPPRLH